jgi:hypothetical protein
MKRQAFAILLAGFCVACSSGGTVPSTDNSRTPARADKSDWSRLANKRIFFGHQSVGYNILEGVEDLIAAKRGPTLRIVETGDAGALQPGVLAHAMVGKNEDPGSKIRDFAKYMRSGIAANSDIALFKFCYIDVEPIDDIAPVFSEYKQTMTELARQYPSTKFVHATMPLRMVQTGPKALVKRVLGRPAGGYLDNVKRNVYNDMLRREYAGREPIFDIAKLESQAADSEMTFVFQGQRFFSLDPKYTPDNGHLNEIGRRIVAAGFLDALSAGQAPGN